MPDALAPLKQQIRSMRDGHPDLDDEDRFIVWFLLSRLTSDPHEAEKALTGRSREKGIDALQIDDTPRLVTVVQGKYRAKNTAREKRDDVMGFARLATVLTQADSEFEPFAEQLEPAAARKAKAARERLRNRGYRLDLHYVTSGVCSKPLADEASKVVRGVRLDGERPARLSVFDWSGILLLLQEYLAGVAPPVPYLDLPIEGRSIVDLYDEAADIDSWIFPMLGSDVGELVDRAGAPLFARNIRGHLGNVKINKEIRSTIKNQPSEFLYLNNGITIICDDAQEEKSGGRSVLHVTNPQIINGQQTTYALANGGRQAKKARVFVRVIKVPRSAGEAGSATYDAMVDKIVAATNSQTAVKPADLRSNDHRQVELQREFHKLRCFYVRKRGDTGDKPGSAVQQIIKMEDVAKAVAGCEDASFTRNEGMQALFEGKKYKSIFNHAPEHLLSCWWLQKILKEEAKGNGEYAWSRAVVLQHLWTESSIEQHKRAFNELCGRRPPDPDVTHLRKACGHLLRASIRFYVLNRGSGDDRQEVSAFFKRRTVYADFAKFLRSAKGKTYRAAYKDSLRRFDSALQN